MVSMEQEAGQMANVNCVDELHKFYYRLLI